jgi:hypothetical protein
MHILNCLLLIMHTLIRFLLTRAGFPSGMSSFLSVGAGKMWQGAGAGEVLVDFESPWGVH